MTVKAWLFCGLALAVELVGLALILRGDLTLLEIVVFLSVVVAALVFVRTLETIRKRAER